LEATIARPRRLPEALQAHDFHALAKKEPHSRTRVRLLGMAHLQEGRNYHEIATALRVHATTVHGWMLRFETAGLDGLRESPRSGAKRKVGVSQEAKIKEAVLGLQEQRSGGRITGHDVRAMLEEQFQVACSLNSVYNLLARLDLVWITVRSKHPKQSQTRQDTFKKTFATR
jgi:transposase